MTLQEQTHAEFGNARLVAELDKKFTANGLKVVDDRILKMRAFVSHRIRGRLFKLEETDLDSFLRLLEAASTSPLDPVPEQILKFSRQLSLVRDVVDPDTDPQKNFVADFVHRFMADLKERTPAEAQLAAIARLRKETARLYPKALLSATLEEIRKEKARARVLTWLRASNGTFPIRAHKGDNDDGPPAACLQNGDRTDDEEVLAQE